MAPPIPADPGEQDPEGAIRSSEPRSSGRSPQDLDLVPQGEVEVLEGQLPAGAMARDAGALEWFQQERHAKIRVP
jgi:hypothetical protein